MPIFVKLRGVVEPYELTLVDFLHVVSKGVGHYLQDEIVKIIQTELGSAGLKAFNDIFANILNVSAGYKYFAHGVSGLANEKAKEVTFVYVVFHHCDRTLTAEAGG